MSPTASSSFPKGRRSRVRWTSRRLNGAKLTEAGYTIVLSMGDQQSDLDGGYAERTFKLPNPVYFLP